MFEIGDKVYKTGYASIYEIGTVVKISPKRHDVTVDFGKYKDIFTSSGWLKGQSAFGIVRILHLTPEAEKMINDENTIRKCKELFSNTLLSANKAERIIAILEEGKR